MRKIVLGIVLVTVFLLSSCGVESTDCMENERLMDGVCTTLTNHELTLYDTFLHSSSLDDYTMNVSITERDTRYDMSIYIDQATSKISSEDGTRIELYKKEDGVCFSTSIYNDVIVDSNETCSSFNDYRFFTNFEYNWFEFVEGTYSIKEEYLSEATLLLDDYFDNAIVTELKVASLDEQLSDITIDLLMNEVTYTIHMAFSDINNTTVIFDEVN